MRGAAADLVQAAAVLLQRGLRDVEEVERVLVDGHDLGRGEGGGAGHGHGDRHGLAHHVLIDGLALVLVGLAVRVADELLEAQAQLVRAAQPAQQVLSAAPERAAEGGQARRHLLHGLILGGPGLVAFKDIREVPGEFLGHLAAFAFGIDHRNGLLSNAFLAPL